MSSSLISTGELASRLANPELVILDASWHLPAAGRDPWQEFLNSHIPNARFFDIDGISDPNSPLPHMLPSEKQFSAAAPGNWASRTTLKSWYMTRWGWSAPLGAGGHFVYLDINRSGF